SGDAAARTPEPAPVSSGRERSQAFITAGNDAYRAGDFELALKRYAAAAVADPRDPAAYFGMGMTFTRLKREDEARAAYARAQQLARGEVYSRSTSTRSGNGPRRAGITPAVRGEIPCSGRCRADYPWSRPCGPP